jgi:hypothetical protein
VRNLPPGCTEDDIDRTVSEEPEYELIDADLDEAYLESLELSCPAWEDNLLIDAAIEERRMERWAA